MRSAALIRRRDELPGFLKALGLTGVGVEIGVQRGIYSERILADSRLSKVVLVDPWAAADDEYRDVANVSQLEHDQALTEARSRLEGFGERVQFWRMTSLEAASKVSDGTVDFVYIDGRHDYESVLADLRAWHPKLTSRGVIAGHDYLDAHGFGVRSAVTEFFSDKGIVVYETFAEPDWPTWIAAEPTRYPMLVHAGRFMLALGPRVRRKGRHVRRTRRWS
jgi:Methyltransferase domain